MPAPADQMFLQLRTMHADELRKRVSNGCVMKKSDTAELRLAPSRRHNNNAVASLAGKEMTGTAEHRARLDIRPHMANR
jgi:hypothetical protein